MEERKKNQTNIRLRHVMNVFEKNIWKTYNKNVQNWIKVVSSILLAIQQTHTIWAAIWVYDTSEEECVTIPWQNTILFYSPRNNKVTRIIIKIKGIKQKSTWEKSEKIVFQNTQRAIKHQQQKQRKMVTNVTVYRL